MTTAKSQVCKFISIHWLCPKECFSTLHRYPETRRPTLHGLELSFDLLKSKFVTYTFNTYFVHTCRYLYIYNIIYSSIHEEYMLRYCNCVRVCRIFLKQHIILIYGSRKGEFYIREVLYDHLRMHIAYFPIHFSISILERRERKMRKTRDSISFPSQIFNFWFYQIYFKSPPGINKCFAAFYLQC